MKKNKPLKKLFLKNAECLKNIQHLEKKSVTHLLFSLYSPWKWDFLALRNPPTFSAGWILLANKIHTGWSLSNHCSKVTKMNLLWIQLLLYDEQKSFH